MSATHPLLWTAVKTVPKRRAGNAAELKVMIEQAMREHAAVAPRGFDSRKKRDHLHRQIDDMLDDWALESMVEPA